MHLSSKERRLVAQVIMNTFPPPRPLPYVMILCKTPPPSNASESPPPSNVNVNPISVSHLVECKWISITPAQIGGDFNDQPKFVIRLSPQYSMRHHVYFHPSNYKNCHGIVGSCNGLIRLHHCVSFNYYFEEHSFRFMNPTTKTTKFEAVSLRPHIYFKFGFGYDNSTDTYNMVMLRFCPVGDVGGQVRNTGKVFTLGVNIWKDIQSLPVVAVFHPKSILVDYNSEYLSNSLSWLVYHSYTSRCNNLTIQQFVIISLDLRIETYTKLLLPPCYDQLPSLDTPTLCVLMDCLCFTHDFEKTHFIIWQMKEFRAEEWDSNSHDSWTQILKRIFYPLTLQKL